MEINFYHKIQILIKITIKVKEIYKSNKMIKYLVLSELLNQKKIILQEMFIIKNKNNKVCKELKMKPTNMIKIKIWIIIICKTK